MELEQAAALLICRMGVPDCVAQISAQSDKRGEYLLLRLAPGYPGRISVPPSFQGFRVIVETEGGRPNRRT